MNNDQRDSHELATLSAIHAASNACARYQRESGGRDVWQTPAELAASGVGDCEDFAIDAMFRTINAGMSARIGCCRRSDDQMHMVCMVYGSFTDPWVLDVAVDAVCRLSDRPDLELVYELGVDGVYVGGKRVGGVERNALWAGVLERMSSKGGVL
jgi:predicted transglutaminase-like cysteine proteinase